MDAAGRDMAAAAGGAGGAGPSPDAGAPALDGGLVLPSVFEPLLKTCPWIAGKAYAAPSDVLFDPAEIVRFDVDITPADLQVLLTRDAELFVPVTLSFCGLRFVGAGMRFRKSPLAIRRGIRFKADPKNPSLFFKKNPILIDLNELVPASNQKLFGLRKINLDYGSDQLLVAERMSWETLRSFGLNVSRVNSAVLYVNGQQWGIFTHVERVDRSFAQHHYGNDSGNLYKHSYCGTFAWKGSDPALYKNDCYAIKTNELVADYLDIVRLADTLNNSANLKADLPKVLNVAEWLKLAAALQSTGYGDTPAANGNNYYTYHSSSPDRFEITPWDLDGGFWWTGQPCEPTADTINWGLFRIAKCFTSVPLFQKVVGAPDWRGEYLRHARAFVEGAFAPAKYVERVDALMKLLGPAVAADPNRLSTDTAWRMEIETLKSLQRRRVDAVKAELVRLGY